MDDITKAFSNISMKDFERKTSASSQQVYGPEDEGLTGLTNFNQFVDGHLLASRTLAYSEEFTPLAILHSLTMQSIFIPDEDETVNDFANRLERESRALGATWFFSAVLSCGRAYNSEDDVDPLPIDDPVELAEALERGEVEVAICWYAEMNEPEEKLTRAGLIGFTEGAPNQGIEGLIDPEKNPFHFVLNRRPQEA